MDDARASHSHPEEPKITVSWQEQPKNHPEPEPGESQWKINIKDVPCEKLNSYSFSLTQIVNFSPTSCRSDIK